MERIAEADETSGADLVRDHAGDPASERLAADDEAGAAAERRDDVLPAVQQNGRAIGRAALAPFAALRHVWEFESNNAESTSPEPRRDAVHERRVHRSAGSVRQRDRRGRVLGTVEQVAVSSDRRQVRSSSAFRERPMNFLRAPGFES